jgi:hypothetical protein
MTRPSTRTAASAIPATPIAAHWLHRTPNTAATKAATRGSRRMGTLYEGKGRGRSGEGGNQPLHDAYFADGLAMSEYG